MSNDKQQIKIGLTGGIGSGKTFVCSIFQKLGIPVFNTDIQAKKCMTKDEFLKQRHSLNFESFLQRNHNI